MNITEKEIGELKLKFPKIHQIDVTSEEDDKTYSVIVRPPNRNDLGRIKRLGNGDSFKEMEILFNAICLAGDKNEILNDDSLFLGVIEQINTLIKTAQASIKKL